MKIGVCQIPMIGRLAQWPRKIFRYLWNLRQTLAVLRGLIYCFFHTDRKVKVDDGLEIRLLTDSLREYNFARSATSEVLFIQTIMTYLSKKDVVYDVGAMLGLHSMCFAKKAREVHSFEPSPKNIRRMKQNFRHNDIHNIRTCECAVGSQNGYCNFYVESGTPVSGLNSISRDALGYRKTSEITVPTVTLDSYASNHHYPTVVKMDIEGAEFEALKGSVKLLREHEVLFFIELHLKKLAYLNTTRDQIVRFFQQNAYQVKTILRRGLYSEHICAFLINSRRKTDLPARC
jgi:FkbM family methyltransferase